MPANDPDLPHESEDIDQKIRINELKEELREVTGREPTGMKSPDCTPALEEEFLRNMLAYESSRLTTQLEQVTRSGFELPETERLDVAQISAKLADLIARLGRRRTFLYQTNHLSDRELYDWLRERGLREEVPDVPVSPKFISSRCSRQLQRGGGRFVQQVLRHRRAAAKTCARVSRLAVAAA